MKARFVLLAGFGAAACNKGGAGSADSTADEADADTDTDTDGDTDSDTDGDTDTDTDTDTDADFQAEIQVTVTVVETSDIVCDTTVELVGTPYAGTCDGCAFAYEMTGEITAEAGSGCLDGYLDTYATYLADASVPEVWLAFSDVGTLYAYYEHKNILWHGESAGGKDVTWAPNAFDGSIFGYAAYAGGVLDWTLDYDDVLPTKPYADTHVHAVGHAVVP